MLAAAHRLVSAEGFRHVIRHGTKAGRSTLVLHMAKNHRAESRAGFVVSKAVGNAVTRNRVKRRLRHLVAPRILGFSGVDVVIRANPAAVTGNLGTDLESAWNQCRGAL